MNVLSLFSGIGGFDLGFERAGMTVVGMCEIDRHAQTVLRRRFPSATLHTDVRKVTYERGAVDLICGGFPCQDLSTAGKRRGLAGEKSGLWHEFARIIDMAEPAWVVIENVFGLLSSNGGKDLAVIINWLVHRGYGVGWRVLDAQGFGLAQRRKRVFIVASFGSPRGCTVLLEPQNMQINITKATDEEKAFVSDVGEYTTHDEQLIALHDICPTLRTSTCIIDGFGDFKTSLVAVYIGKILHAVRRLTPTECERLQGFPDGWTEGQSDAQRYKQLGNAVAVPVAEWIGRRILTAIS